MQNIAVIGLGRFGTALAVELEAAGAEVLAIDTDHDGVDDVAGLVQAAHCLDATDPEALKAIGLAELDLVIVAIGENFESTQSCVLALEQIGVKRIWARAQTDDRLEILKRIGAHEVVSPEVESAKRVALQLTHPLLAESVDLGDGVIAATIPVPRTDIGKTLAEVGASADHDVLVVRVTRYDENGVRLGVVIPATAGTVLEENDELTLVGSLESIARFSDR